MNRYQNIPSLLLWLLLILIPTHTSGDESGLVAHWDFYMRRGNIALDRSGNGLNGLIHEAKRTRIKRIRALNFDGVDDYFYVPKNDLFNFPEGDFSIALALMPSDLRKNSSLIVPGSRVRGFIIGVGGGYGNKIIMFLGSWDKYRYSPPGIIKEGYWTHAVFVKRDKNIDCYIDGKLRNGAGTEVNIDVNPVGSLQIGGLAGYGFFHGMIDDIQIFNRALSPNEVRSLYQELSLPTSTKYFISSIKKIARYSLITALIIFTIYMRIFWARKEQRET